MTLRNRLAHLGGIALLSVAMVGQAAANHSCRNTGTFEQWLAGFKQEALASGISQSTISRALDGATYDPNIIRRDHGQGVFQQSFIQFSDRMANKNRFQNGLAQMKKNAQLFARIEQQFGVPASVIVAFWDWRPTTALKRPRRFLSSVRWQPWPMTAAAPISSAHS